MLFPACFRNSNDLWLAQHPRECDLGRSRVVTRRDLVERRAFEQSAPVTNRRVGHYRNRMLLAPLQETGFNPPVFPVVGTWIGGAGEPLPVAKRLLHTTDIKIRAPPRLGLPASPPFPHALPCPAYRPPP